MTITLKPISTDGVLYDKAFVEALARDVIDLRNQALEQAEMEFAVSLSHVLVVLNYYINTVSE